MDKLTARESLTRLRAFFFFILSDDSKALQEINLTINELFKLIDTYKE